MCLQGTGGEGVSQKKSKAAAAATDGTGKLKEPRWKLPCRVEVRFADGEWYPGELSKSAKSGIWTVDFDDGDERRYTAGQMHKEMTEANFRKG